MQCVRYLRNTSNLNDIYSGSGPIWVQYGSNMGPIWVQYGSNWGGSALRMGVTFGVGIGMGMDGDGDVGQDSGLDLSLWLNSGYEFQFKPW